jgi:hypothetical protein
MLGDCSGPRGAAIIAAPRDPSEAPTDVEADPPAPAAAPTALIMRRLGSARDLVRSGRKLSRHGFDIGEQVTEKGSTVVAEVNDPTTALPQHVPTETAPLNSLRSTATFRLAHNTGPYYCAPCTEPRRVASPALLMGFGCGSYDMVRTHLGG